MLERIASLFGRGGRHSEHAPPVDEHDFVRKLRTLELDLADRNNLISELRKDLEQTRAKTQVKIDLAINSNSEKMIAELAAPVSQLLTQVYLHETIGKDVQIDSVFAVSRRLVRVLSEFGLQIQGEVGETVQFDPNYHQPLSRDHSIQSDEAVVVRFAGIGFDNKVIQKAGVESLGR
ncbi:MAG: nucleotide exchange factor GrpE [Planctomycetota bacterium]|nr:MAG: nucleotide exchange factor GrpE [Planctomycetota bacterium]REK25967.1 MAG: nucleotide exchange factor GrpE [Planctomycetota bacterium]REK46917.1 MAG: nucleotide exchange factor GrpE [Planctomycetota bacterium]